MKVSNTALRLKQLMEERNLKQIDIVRLAEPHCKENNVKLGRNDISQYVAGKAEPGQHKLYILGKALNVSAAWLMGYDVPIDERKSSSSDEFKPYNPVMHKIPILGYIAAGLPLYADEHIEGYTLTEHNGGAEYFALRVSGDSMSAANIPDSSLLVVRRQEAVENGEIAVVRVNEDNATVKRFKRDGNIIQLIPQSYNPEHQIQIYDLKKDKIDVVGKVVECKVEF